MNTQPVSIVDQIGWARDGEIVMHDYDFGELQASRNLYDPEEEIEISFGREEGSDASLDDFMNNPYLVDRDDDSLDDYMDDRGYGVGYDPAVRSIVRNAEKRKALQKNQDKIPFRREATIGKQDKKRQLKRKQKLRLKARAREGRIAYSQPIVDPGDFAVRVTDRGLLDRTNDSDDDEVVVVPNPNPEPIHEIIPVYDFERVEDRVRNAEKRKALQKNENRIPFRREAVIGKQDKKRKWKRNRKLRMDARVREGARALSARALGGNNRDNDYSQRFLPPTYRYRNEKRLQDTDIDYRPSRLRRLNPYEEPPDSYGRIGRVTRRRLEDGSAMEFFSGTERRRNPSTDSTTYSDRRRMSALRSGDFRLAAQLRAKQMVKRAIYKSGHKK